MVRLAYFRSAYRRICVRAQHHSATGQPANDVADRGLCLGFGVHHATNVINSAKAANLAKGWLCCYFDSKDVLTDALLWRHFDQILAEVSAYPAPSTPEISVSAL
ncbi:MAG: hypothetical protein ACPG61_01580 [Paracoccaceae bacterium]